MSITREQRDEIERLAQNIGDTVTATHRGHAWDEMHNYLDSLVAEPAEQPQLMTSDERYERFGRPIADALLAEARLHADDARAAMVALICEPQWSREGHSLFSSIGVPRSLDPSESFAWAAHEIADAMSDERKRRMK